MDRLVKKYAAKLVDAGLASPKADRQPIVGGLDDKLIWNRQGPEIETLTKVIDGLSINSLVYLKPAGPYGSIIEYLAKAALQSNGPISPSDCETRTFLHDLPVVEKFSAEPIIAMLKHRKSVIVADFPDTQDQRPAIISFGTVSPEQGYVVASSVCFASFVKFFADYLADLKSGVAAPAMHTVFDDAIAELPHLKSDLPDLMPAPFTSESQVYRAITQAGRQTVEYGLVDSYFGNISFVWQDKLYISQTGSSLEELKGCIDPVALDGSNSAALTASSELSAHLEALARTQCRALIHGHPKFAVVLSMDCDPVDRADCPHIGRCHIKCPKERFVEDIPIVPGEVGTGPTGLCHTLPPALEKNPTAIVYGHGVFALGKDDFTQAFAGMLEAEALCREKYFKMIDALR